MTDLIDGIAQRYRTWRARGRSRDGFFRLICRAFDDVAGAVDAGAPDPSGGLAYLDATFAVRSAGPAPSGFAALQDRVSRLGLLGPGSPLDGQDEDDVWPYLLTLVAEKTCAWLAQAHPDQPGWLLALACLKERLHQPEDALDLRKQARKICDRGAKRMRAAAVPSRAAAV